MREGIVVDVLETKFGFREAVFKSDGFYLNGAKFKLRGLNRHQSFPYVGYAMPESMQKFDVEILKRMKDRHDRSAMINNCYELPLQQWNEIVGSKLKYAATLKDFIKLIFSR